MRKILADDFFNSSRFLKNKKNIVKDIIKQCKKINKVMPPIGGSDLEYNKLLEQGADYKGGNFWYPYIGSGIGNNAYVELADGSVKIDLISGIGVHYLGHSNHGVVAHSIDGAVCNTVHNGHLQQNADSIKLMKSILNLANRTHHDQRLAHCFLSTSGAMANENALKVAFQNKPGSDRVLCFEKCFSGRSLATACMTDKAGNRVGLPTTLNVDYIPFDSHASLSILQKHIDRFPGKHAAMCIELVQGEGGYNTADMNFFHNLSDVLSQNNIALWIDEIQTFGRTLKPFAFQHYGLEDKVDIVTIGKAAQVCATLFTSDLKPKPGLLSQTFTSTSVAIKTSQFIMDYIEKHHDSLFEDRIPQIRKHFVDRFDIMTAEFGGHIIGGVHGLGGMIAIELFNGDLNKSILFTKKLFKDGVISFIAGKNPTRVRFLPPVNITPEIIDEAMDIFENTLKEFT
jgi:acetylornithine aminotransferase